MYGEVFVNGTKMHMPYGSYVCCKRLLSLWSCLHTKYEKIYVRTLDFDFLFYSFYITLAAVHSELIFGI